MTNLKRILLSREILNKVNSDDENLAKTILKRKHMEKYSFGKGNTWKHITRERILLLMMVLKWEIQKRSPKIKVISNCSSETSWKILRRNIGNNDDSEKENLKMSILTE